MTEKKAQMKIQQMAFVLVAIIIFFALVSLFYFSVRIKNVESSAISLREDEAKELVRKLSGSPEFSWTASDCSSCIDFDKAILLKDKREYADFWGLDYLAIERVYPAGKGECTRANYPDCSTLTLVNKTSTYGAPASAYVALCKQDYDKSAYVRCELGRIYAAGEGIE